MQQWEYRLVSTKTNQNGLVVISVDLKELNETTLPKTLDYLNQLGREGWEIIGTATTLYMTQYILKRPLPVER